jgi:hypothetical protein
MPSVYITKNGKNTQEILNQYQLLDNFRLIFEGVLLTGAGMYDDNNPFSVSAAYFFPIFSYN